MNAKQIYASKQCLIFLILSSVLFLLHWFFKDQEFMPKFFDVHFLIFILSFIVVLSISIIYTFEAKDKIGFVYLGFVLFKMFGIGYLAVFVEDFKNYLLVYFSIFWMYLSIEAILIINFLKKSKFKNY